MFEFLGVLSEGGEVLPAFGDGDDGYVLDIGNDSRNVREWLAVGAVLFERSDFKAYFGAGGQDSFVGLASGFCLRAFVCSRYGGESWKTCW